MKPSRIYKPHIDAYAVNNLARQDPQKLIDFSEDRYRSQISEVAEEFAAGFPHSRIILLSGPTSSGKTTTSHNLDAELEKRGIATFALSLDDFFFDRDRAPLLPGGTRDYETPALVDTETLERCLFVAPGAPEGDFTPEGEAAAKAAGARGGFVCLRFRKK